MKAYNYSMMILGMLLLLEFGGITVGSNFLSIVGIGTDSFGLSASNFKDFILGSAGILAIVGISTFVIGLFVKFSGENLIILPFITGMLAVFIEAAAGVINYSIGNHPTWVSGIIILILAPLTFGYLFSLVEFFRGTD